MLYLDSVSCFADFSSYTDIMSRQLFMTAIQFIFIVVVQMLHDAVGNIIMCLAQS